jgi:hypothetical protein
MPWVMARAVGCRAKARRYVFVVQPRLVVLVFAA